MTYDDDAYYRAEAVASVRDSGRHFLYTDTNTPHWPTIVKILGNMLRDAETEGYEPEKVTVEAHKLALRCNSIAETFAPASRRRTA